MSGVLQTRWQDGSGSGPNTPQTPEDSFPTWGHKTDSMSIVHYNKNTNLRMSCVQCVHLECSLLFYFYLLLRLLLKSALILADKQQHVTNHYLQSHDPTNHFRDTGMD